MAAVQRDLEGDEADGLAEDQHLVRAVEARLLPQPDVVGAGEAAALEREAVGLDQLRVVA